MTGRRLFIASFLLLIGAAGCLPGRFNSRPQPLPLTVTLDRLNPADYPAEIARLEMMINSPAPESPEKNEARRRLALLYLLPASPLRDEPKGAAVLQTYIAQLPEGAARQEYDLWLQLLQNKILQAKDNGKREETKRRAATALEMETQKLSRQVQELTTSNAKLREDIEKLKMIDLAVEKKRKNFR